MVWVHFSKFDSLIRLRQVRAFDCQVRQRNEDGSKTTRKTESKQPPAERDPRTRPNSLIDPRIVRPGAGSAPDQAHASVSRRPLREAFALSSSCCCCGGAWHPPPPPPYHRIIMIITSDGRHCCCASERLFFSCVCSRCLSYFGDCTASSSSSFSAGRTFAHAGRTSAQ